MISMRIGNSMETRDIGEHKHNTCRRQLIRSEVLISQEATKSQTIGKEKHASTVTMQRSDM